MSKYIYVNGHYLLHDQAFIHVEDRGYQFSDSVYEVIYLYNNHLIDEEGHLHRLENSLSNINCTMPVNCNTLKLLIRELIRRNKLLFGLIYIQITRGIAPRDHKFPLNTKPSLIMSCKKLSYSEILKQQDIGINIITVPDERWKRCDIKSTMLLPNVLAKQQAFEQQAFEAIMIDSEGFLTEGTSTNLWILNKDGILQTHEANHKILNGITRQRLIALIKEKKIPFIEKKFALHDLQQAKEAFITSTSSMVKPIIKLNGKSFNNEIIGPMVIYLKQLYLDYVLGQVQ
ncbi:MAG: D-amino-acid transaminase [Alphaproteobacteria bacterium]|nr:D-amino-acid transaminase [Alphaproteobacteria bacterium]